VQCITVDEGRVVKVTYKTLKEKDIERLRRLAEDLGKGFSEKNAKAYIEALGECGLISSDTQGIWEKLKEQLQKYGNLTLEDIRKKVVEINPNLEKTTERILSKLASSGIDPNTRLKDIMELKEPGPFPFNILCFLLYFGCGALTLPPEWVGPFPSVIGIAGIGLVASFGALLHEGGLTIFIIFLRFTGFIVTYICECFPHAGPMPCTVAFGFSRFAGFWIPGYDV